ncbi:uncharacterized protein LOC104455547 [Eucalyptus grandis]|uniref:uncharacterized protein LOC104455547 n=1 Tax=Eucalyptus grandis TaxID=71139 RepID=UPI00192EA5BC|nr:uncharacterized protein LOC104455547 [Eucalyptus grandis]
MATNKASQDNRGPAGNEEIREEGSSNGTATDKPSQEGRIPTKVKTSVKVNEKYRPLFEAALKGDWKAVEEILNKDCEAITAEVMTVEDKHITVLDVAVMAAQDQLVKNLVNRFSLDHEDFILKSALYNAARRGRIKMVKALVDKVDAEPESVAHALSYAISDAPMHKEVIWYLARHVKSAPDYDTMSSLIMAGHFGIPPRTVDTSFDNFKDMKMAQVTFIKRIGEAKLRHKCSLEFANLALAEIKSRRKTHEIVEFLSTSDIVLDAASCGISEIVNLCLKHFPELMWERNFTERLMKEVVKGRHVELFRLVNAHKRIPKLSEDVYTNCALMEAVVAMSPSCEYPDVFGAAFLMQRELQWYKVVEDRSSPLKSLKLLEDEKTYREGFVDKCQDLLKEAKQWMKDTSSSCSLVATLIITVAFAAAFTVLGGNDNNTGIPIFFKKNSFMGSVITLCLKYSDFEILQNESSVSMESKKEPGRLGKLSSGFTDESRVGERHGKTGWSGVEWSGVE